MATKQEVIDRALSLGIIARKSEWASIPVKSAEWEACLAKLATRETALSGSVEDTMRAVEEVLHEPGMDDVLAEWNEDDEPDDEFLNNLIQNGESEESAQAAAAESRKWRERPADQRFANDGQAVDGLEFDDSDPQDIGSAEYRRCCTKHYTGPMDPLGYLTGTPEPTIEDCEAGEFDRGGPHDRVAKQPEQQRWVDLAVENQIVWKRKQAARELAAQPMAMNRAARRRMAKLNSTRSQRLAARA